jgi:hypothetical protein
MTHITLKTALHCLFTAQAEMNPALTIGFLGDIEPITVGVRFYIGSHSGNEPLMVWAG